MGMLYELDEVEKRGLLADMKNDQHVTSLTTLRAAILDVIDAGCNCGISAKEHGRHAPWTLDDEDETFADTQRCAFVDAVAAQIKVLQGEPHGMDAVLLARLRDVQANYQRGYKHGRSDAISGMKED